MLNNRLGRLVGTPLGAVLLGTLGLDAVVLVDVLTFVLAAGLVALMTRPRGHVVDAGSVAQRRISSAESPNSCQR